MVSSDRCESIWNPERKNEISFYQYVTYIDDIYI